MSTVIPRSFSTPLECQAALAALRHAVQSLSHEASPPHGHSHGRLNLCMGLSQCNDPKQMGVKCTEGKRKKEPSSWFKSVPDTKSHKILLRLARDSNIKTDYV